MSSTTVTKYAVARGEKILGESHEDVNGAKGELAHYEDGMRALGLEPDVRIVTFDVSTTTTRPRVYKEPEPEVAEDTEPEPTAE